MNFSPSNLAFQISLVEIDDLKPHEEVIEAIFGSLANDIVADGNLRNPLIVDQNQKVILDGMHRHKSLQTLNCRFAPCYLVDYDSALIRVGAWFRLFAVGDPELIAETVLTQAGLNFSTRKIGSFGIPADPHSIILTDSAADFFLTESLDHFEQARTAVLLERELVKKGHAVEYLSEIQAVEKLRSRAANLVISVPMFTKQEVREFAFSRRLLPHKVTRHVIPSRPLHADVPLELLRDPGISRADADTKLHHLLANRRVERKTPGSTIDGRRYEEELLVFSS